MAATRARANTSTDVGRETLGGAVVIARTSIGSRSRLQRVRVQDPDTRRLSSVFQCLDCPQGEFWTTYDDARGHRATVHKGVRHRRAETKEPSEKAAEPDPPVRRTRRPRQPHPATARLTEDVLAMPLREVLELAAQIELLANALHETERARDKAREEAVLARRELRQFKTGLKRLGFTERGIVGNGT